MENVMNRNAPIDNKIDHLERLSALKWYFESKNLALKNALKLRCQLSVEQQGELRQYYSGYFAGLISATELLCEPEYAHSKKFKQLLKDNFVFDQLPSGEENYLYLRELRNSIIHRGFDISSSAHVKDDFPFVLAPSSVSDRTGRKSYQALGFYLLEVISKSESAIGPLIVRHLEEVELLKPTLTKDQAMEEARRFIAQSEAMPEWAKKLAYESIASVDFVEGQMTMINGLVEVLRSNALSSIDGEWIRAAEGRQDGQRFNRPKSMSSRSGLREKTSRDAN
jgi:hypothetical protein